MRGLVKLALQINMFTVNIFRVFAYIIMYVYY